MSAYPHTIDNGAGERLTFVAVRRDDRGEYIELLNSVDPGAGPPMHVHHLQEEGLTVERGTIGYQSEGGPEQTAGRGESVTFAPGESHRFWNAGEDELACTGFVRPPGNLGYFLTEMYASMRRSGGDRPGFFDGAFLGQRYRSEFEMTEIPLPVRRLVSRSWRPSEDWSGYIGATPTRRSRYAGALPTPSEPARQTRCAQRPHPIRSCFAPDASGSAAPRIGNQRAL